MGSAVVPLPMHPDEEAAQALARDEPRRALSVLMEAYGDDLYRHCRLVLGDPALADDVLQTVFVQAFRDFAQWSGRSSLRTWLFAIARHRCLDALRTTRRLARRFLGSDCLDDSRDPRPRPDERLVRRAELEALERALKILKPKIRIAVLLRFHEGLSYAEMAEVCGEAAPTLQARVARALPLLRRHIEKNGGVL